MDLNGPSNRRRLLRQRVNDSNSKDLINEIYESHVSDLRHSMDSVSNNLQEREDATNKHKNQLVQNVFDQYDIERNELIQQGDSYIEGLHAGRLLYKGTGLIQKDPLAMDIQNVKLEADILQQGHEVWRNNIELENYLNNEITPRTANQRKLRDDQHRVEQNAQIDEINKKFQFLDMINESDKDTEQLENKASLLSQDALKMMESLRKNYKILDVDARAAMRRKILQKQGEAKEMYQKAEAARDNSKQLKRHLNERGLEPNSYIPQPKLDQDMDRKDSERTEKDDWTPSQLENPALTLAQQAHMAASHWEQYLIEGQRLGQMDRLDAAQRRVDCKAEAEATNMKAQERQLEISRRKMDPCYEQDAEQSEAAKLLENIEVMLDASISGIASPSLTFQSSAALSSPNTVNRVAGNARTFAAPPLCVPWTRGQCHNKTCLHRHYFLTKGEEYQQNAINAEREASLEVVVLDAIEKRERYLERLKQLSISCGTQTVSEYVNTDEIRPMLHVMNKLRTATVAVVEAIEKWRDFELGTRAHAVDEHRPSGGRTWVVKIAQRGDRLYPSSNGLDKYATVYSFHGEFDSKEEALQVYDKAIRAQAVREMRNIVSLPKPKMIIRSCGKHGAIESDLGYSNTRCEICFARAQDGTPVPRKVYFWNKRNYLLKVCVDTAFLGEVGLLREFFKTQLQTRWLQFDHNPLLLARPLLHEGTKKTEYQNEVQKSQTHDDQIEVDTSDKKRKRIEFPDETEASKFGLPASMVMYHESGCMEWNGHVSTTTSVQVGTQRAYVTQMAQDGAAVDRLVANHEGASVTVLDLKRIRHAQSVLRDEIDIATMMFDTKDQQTKQPELESESNREELTSAFKSQPENLDTLSLEEIMKLRGQYIPPKSVQNLTMAERLSLDQEHTAYYYERGEYMAISQPRYTRTGKIPDKWASKDKGSMFEGMRTHGPNMRYFEAQESRQQDGKALQDRRQLIVNRIRKSIQRADFANPRTLETLITIGKEAGGSVLLAEIEVAKKFLANWHERQKASIVVQRVSRGMLARGIARERDESVNLRLRRASFMESESKTIAKHFVKDLFQRRVRKCRAILKKPLVTFGTVLDGEAVTASFHNPSSLEKYSREKLQLLESCRVCNGAHVEESKIPPSSEEVDALLRKAAVASEYKSDSMLLEVMRKRRRAKRSPESGPCYCIRRPAICDRLHIQIYHTLTSQIHISVMDESLLVDYVEQAAVLRDRLMLPNQDELKQSRKDPRNSNLGDLCFENNKRLLCASLDDNLYLPFATVEYLQKYCRYLGKILSARGEWTTREDDALTNLSCEQATCSVAYDAAQDMYYSARAMVFVTQVHEQAMNKATNDALEFAEAINRNPDIYATEQPFDPLEDATNAVYIQRKRQAIKAGMLARQRLEDAYNKLVDAQTYVADLSANMERTSAFVQELTFKYTSLSRIHESMQHNSQTAYKNFVTFLRYGVIAIMGIRSDVVDEWTRGCAKRIMLKSLPEIRSPDLVPGENVVMRATKSITCSSGIVKTYRVLMVEEHKNGVNRNTVAALETNDTVDLVPNVLRISLCCESECIEFKLQPEELRRLVVDEHYGHPGESLRGIFSSFSLRIAMTEAAKQQGSMTYQLMRDCVEDQRQRIFARLFELIHYDTVAGVVGIGKLKLFRTCRSFYDLIVATQWWKDMCRGKTSRKGVLVFNSIASIAGQSAMVAVFENLGSLIVEVNWNRVASVSSRNSSIRKPRRKIFKNTSLVLTKSEIDACLASSNDTTLLTLWQTSVECGRYKAFLIEEILKRLVREGDTSPTQNNMEPLVLKNSFKLADNRDQLEVCETTVNIGEFNYHISVSTSYDGAMVMHVTSDTYPESLSLNVSRETLRKALDQMQISHLNLSKNHQILGELLMRVLFIDTQPPAMMPAECHPLFGRYFCMLRRGVPLAGVQHAMCVANWAFEKDIQHQLFKNSTAFPNLDDALQVVAGRHDAMVGLEPGLEIALPPVLRFALDQAKERFSVVYRSLVENSKHDKYVFELWKQDDFMVVSLSLVQKRIEISEDRSGNMLDVDKLPTRNILPSYASGRGSSRSARTNGIAARGWREARRRQMRQSHWASKYCTNDEVIGDFSTKSRYRIVNGNQELPVMYSLIDSKTFESICGAKLDVYLDQTSMGVLAHVLLERVRVSNDELFMYKNMTREEFDYHRRREIKSMRHARLQEIEGSVEVCCEPAPMADATDAAGVAAVKLKSFVDNYDSVRISKLEACRRARSTAGANNDVEMRMMRLNECESYLLRNHLTASSERFATIHKAFLRICGDSCKITSVKEFKLVVFNAFKIHVRKIDAENAIRIFGARGFNETSFSIWYHCFRKPLKKRWFHAFTRMRLAMAQMLHTPKRFIDPKTKPII